MKTFTHRIVALALCLCLMLSMVPAVQAEEAPVGTFYFTVMTANNTVIEPESVPYTEGQTVMEALLAAGYEMEITEDGTVTTINGVEASYLRFYDNGAYDMGVLASEIRAMLFCVNPVYSEPMLDLICVMGAYNEATNNVQNDPDASAAYAAALVQMRSANEQTARQLYTALNSAVTAYESRLNSAKYDVAFRVTQNGAAVENAAVRMTDAYGNVTEGIGSVGVVAGEYTYCVSDGGVNRTEGTVTVSASAVVDVTLPSGDWFGDVVVMHGESEDSRVAYEAARADHHVTWYVDDTADTDSLYLYAHQGQVPAATTQLYTLYEGTNDFDYSVTYRSWSSKNVKLANLVDMGMDGRTFTLEARYTEGDTVQIQEMTVEVVRVPTLKTLTIQQTGIPLYLPFDPAVTEYTLRATQDSVTVTAECFTADETTVTVNGEEEMTVALQDGSNQVSVQVAHTNGQSRTYVLNIEKTASTSVKLETPDGVDAEIRNLDGIAVEPLADGSYALIPGDTYECLSTVDTWLHASKQFVASDGLTVVAEVPQTEDYLKDMVFYNLSGVTNRKAYELDKPFDPDTHSYVMPVLDTAGSLYAQATETASDIAVTVTYKTQSSNIAKCGLDSTILIDYDVSATGVPRYLSAALTASGYTQTFTVRAQRTVDGVVHYQDYLITAPKTLHLNNLMGMVDMEQMELLDEAKELDDFTRTQLDYKVQVLSTAKTMTLSGAFPNENTASPIGGGYYVLVNGVRYDVFKDIVVDLTTIADGGVVAVQVCHADTQAVSQTYRLTVEKAEPVPVSFRTNPEDAVVFVINNKNGAPVYATEDGSFPLIPGNSYTYNVTARGYNGSSKNNFTAPEEAKTVRVTLMESPENNCLPAYEAEWPSFRQNSDNNGVMNAASPVTPESAVLYWAKKVGLGWYGDACGCPILVDDHIYIYAGEKIFKLDKTTGEVVAEGDMDHSSNFAITNATYGDGMIFVGLSNGSVQAFNAETLESLWLYEDALGGQPNCPIAYADGYIYTGFWISETANANFVCLSVTDEDPAQPMESKIASWTYTAPGGFYWSGANVSENYVLVGTDDGQTGNSRGYASLVCLDVRTGALLSAVKLPHTGDVRCSITYDEASDAYYFATKGGYFYQVRVSEDGVIDADGMRSIQLQNGSGEPASSSSSPTIYNGRAYVGVGGVGAYAPYTGHNISVIDLENWEIAYSVPTQGNPQTSGVLTTAYDEGDGTVYIYFLDNYTPGKLRVIQDKAGQSEPIELITEVYKEQDYSVAPVLFTPYDEQTQYAICSPIVDSDGTLYFKNDSGYLMAVGTKVESLSLTAQPAKTSYYTGEKFDPTGMKVTATYANGTTRDVTNALVWNEDALTLQDDTFELVLPMCYQNGADGKAGVAVESPVLTLQLKITEAAQPMEMPFTDVSEGSFCYEPVLWAVSNNVTAGITPTTFEPNTNCTRGQVVTFLWRAAGSPKPSTTTCAFTDVNEKAYYYKAMLWAVENGITAGISATEFAPNDPCTRGQVVTFLWRAAGKPAVSSTKCSFNDVNSSGFYYRAMLWAVEEKITTGTSAVTFAPNTACTRGQIVTFLYRYINN